MSVETIRPGISVSPLKQQYLDYVAQQFDEFIEVTGNEPDAIAFGFTHENGEVTSSWIMPNEPEGSTRCAMFLCNITMYMLNKAIA